MPTVRKKKISTYDRIVDTALILFNEQGERNISTNHISTRLKISPGNLYYHFRNKDEIIFQLFKRYRKELIRFITETPPPSDAQELHDFIAAVFDIMWQYRFFFADVTTLLSRSSELQDEHEKFTLVEVSPLIQRNLVHLIELGMVKMDKLDISIFVSNFWLVIKHWFFFDRSMHDNTLDKHAQLRGLKHILGMLRPYVTEQHRTSFDKVLFNYTLL